MGLAVEEAIVRTAAVQEDAPNTLRFWKSYPAVVMGRFQCLHREVNLTYCLQKGIAMCRRFTGGGCVFVDEGCLNFALCLKQSTPSVPRTIHELYREYVGAIAMSLQDIGIMASFDPIHNSIRLGDYKVTGTAGWIRQGTSFVHGTLLIESDLTMLRNALSPQPDQPVYLREPARVRCVESRRDVVCNIRDHYPDGPSETEIRAAIVRGMERLAGERILDGVISGEELRTAESLYHERYRRPEWNLGVLVETHPDGDPED